MANSILKHVPSGLISATIFHWFFVGAPEAYTKDPPPKTIIVKDDFEDGDLAVDPAWSESSAGNFVTRPLDDGAAVELSPGINASLHLKFYAPQENLRATVRYRYPKWGADYSQVWIGIESKNPGEDYSVRVCDGENAYADGNIALFKDGTTQALATGNTGIPFDNEWHSLTIVADPLDQRIDVYYDDNTIPLLSVHDRTYASFRGAYIGGNSNTTKLIQFRDFSVVEE